MTNLGSSGPWCAEPWWQQPPSTEAWRALCCCRSACDKPSLFRFVSTCSLATRTLLLIESLLLLGTAVLGKLAFMFVAMMYKTLTLNEWYRWGVMCLWECSLLPFTQIKTYVASILYFWLYFSLAFHKYFEINSITQIGWQSYWLCDLRYLLVETCPPQIEKHGLM